jgi:hypothetical protein
MVSDHTRVHAGDSPANIDTSHDRRKAEDNSPAVDQSTPIITHKIGRKQLKSQASTGLDIGGTRPRFPLRKRAFSG